MKKVKNNVEKYKTTAAYKKLKNSLLAHIGESPEEHSKDLVEKYMSLWCHMQLLIEDVNTRGVYVEYQNGANQTGTKRNDSLQDELKVMTQLLNIRSALGIKEAAGGGDVSL